MVFQKLTDEQKQKLFDLKNTHSKDYISKARALMVRGANLGDAVKVVGEREKAKEEYMAQLVRERDSHVKEQEKEEKRSRTPRTRKAKVVEEAPPPEPPLAIEDTAPAKKPRGRKPKEVESTVIFLI